MARIDGRDFNTLREIKIENNYVKHADGSVMISFGDTRVICTAKIKPNYVPAFRKGSGLGWLTAEYSMLPCSTEDRIARTGSGDKPNARALEIQRLIGRALRSSLDFKLLGENTIIIDCDVVQADGGTRTTAITGAFIALENALSKLINTGVLKTMPITSQVAAISIGMKAGEFLLDLNYAEDSNVDVDMNIVMNKAGKLVDIQATAENSNFTDTDLLSMIHLAKPALKNIFEKQNSFFSILKY